MQSLAMQYLSCSLIYLSYLVHALCSVRHQLELCLTSISVIALLAYVIFWNYQGWLLSHRSGYFAPRLTSLPQLVRWAISSIGGRWFIGPLKIEGWENLNQIEKGARIIIAPNHQIEADVWLVGMGLRKHFVRFLMSINQTRGFLRAPFFAWMGAISVGYDKSQPKAKSSGAAVTSAVEALSSELDSMLVIFPQGSLIRNNDLKRDQFYTGVMKIARLSEEKTGQAFFVVPVAAEYCCDKAFATPVQKLLARLGFKRHFFGRTIYGAKIYIGRPLKRSALPADDALALDAYYETLIETRKLCGALS